MLTFRQLRLALGIGTLGLFMMPEPAPGQAPAPGAAKRYTIETIDGVKLKVNYFAGKAADSATVILLHNFDAKAGGDSQKDGWNDLAATLQKEGHHVFSFDFRGHGDSTALVDPKKFFTEFALNAKYLKTAKGVGGKHPETLTYSDFLPLYYPMLVNDIAAVRAFIDRQNDNGTLNSSNIVVIGAGQGATLGALWMAAEFKRHQATPNNPLIPFVIQIQLQPNGYTLKDSAGKDLAAGIFLTPSPTLGGFQVPLKNWMFEIGRNQKVPLAFIHGNEDKAMSRQTLDMLMSISPKYKVGEKPPADLPFTGERGIETKQNGSQLLDQAFKTDAWITKTYLSPVLEKRTILEARTQAFDKNIAFWVFPNFREAVRTNPDEKVPRPIPLDRFDIKR